METWEALPAEEKLYEGEQIKLVDFLETDEPQGTGGSLSVEEIAEMLSNEQQDEDDGEEIIEEKVFLQEAQRACSTLRKFMQQRSANLEVLRACDRLEDEVHAILRKNKPQLTIKESSAAENFKLNINI